MNSLQNVLNHFKIPSKNYTTTEIVTGHINTSYRVHSEDNHQAEYFLQKINPLPFSSVSDVMQNIQLVLKAQQKNPRTFLDALRIIETKNNNLYYIDEQGFYWRLFPFLEGYRIITPSDSPTIMQLMGKAYGGFSQQINTLDPADFHSTIPLFHSLQSRLFSLQKAMDSPQEERNKHVQKEWNIVQKFGTKLCYIDELLAERKLPIRLCHNDTKSSNVMIHANHEKLCVIDLDTVMPGTLLYDYGDAVRSIISNKNEDDAAEITLQWDKQKAFHAGYMEQMSDELTDMEQDLLPTAMIYMPFIMAVRFLTDYLQGDKYFSTHKPEHNLIRAQNQLSLSYKIAQSTNFMQ